MCIYIYIYNTIHICILYIYYMLYIYIYYIYIILYIRILNTLHILYTSTLYYILDYTYMLLSSFVELKTSTLIHLSVTCRSTVDLSAFCGILSSFAWAQLLSSWESLRGRNSNEVMRKLLPFKLHRGKPEIQQAYNKLANLVPKSLEKSILNFNTKLGNL